MLDRLKTWRQLQLPSSAAAVVFGGHLSARLALGEMTGNRPQSATFYTAKRVCQHKNTDSNIIYEQNKTDKLLGFLYLLRMEGSKKIEQGFIIDRLTNSILNTVSGDSFQTEVIRLSKSDLKNITKNKGWNFNWKHEFDEIKKEVYKQWA